jgi:hypothetical protein
VQVQCEFCPERIDQEEIIDHTFSCHPEEVGVGAPDDEPVSDPNACQHCGGHHSGTDGFGFYVFGG